MQLVCTLSPQWVLSVSIRNTHMVNLHITLPTWCCPLQMVQLRYELMRMGLAHFFVLTLSKQECDSVSAQNFLLPRFGGTVLGAWWDSIQGARAACQHDHVKARCRRVCMHIPLTMAVVNAAITYPAHHMNPFLASSCAAGSQAGAGRELCVEFRGVSGHLKW